MCLCHYSILYTDGEPSTPCMWLDGGKLESQKKCCLGLGKCITLHSKIEKKLNGTVRRSQSPEEAVSHTLALR